MSKISKLIMGRFLVLTLGFAVFSNSSRAEESVEAAKVEPAKMETEAATTSETNVYEENTTIEDNDASWYIKFGGDAESLNNVEGNNFVDLNTANIDVSSQNLPNFSGSMGYNIALDDDNFFDNAKFEFEVSHFGNAYSTGGHETSETRFMVNNIYDLTTPSNFRPYVSFGAGFDSINITEDRTGRSIQSTTLPAYQAGVGVAYDIGDLGNASMHLGYRFFKTLKENTLPNYGDVSGKVSMRSIEAKMKVKF